MTHSLLFAAGLLALLTPVRADDTLSGRELQDALEKPLSVAWAGLTRRDALTRLATERKLAVLLDRRIDPSIEIVIPQESQTLHGVLESLLPEGGGARRVGDSVYLGPSGGARRLRTAIALRRAELPETAAPTGRQLDLERVKTLVFADLDTPRDVLQRISDRWELPIEGLDQIPHDLWAGATLSNVTANEALSLVLVQFDLTFAWSDKAAGVVLRPLPESVAVEQLHRVPPGREAPALIAEWKQAFPGIQVSVEGRAVRVVGTVEEHEGIANLQKPGRKLADAPPLKPLDRVRVTLRFDNTVRKLLDALTRAQDTQLTFEFDEQKLKDAGIDLDQRIRFEVKSATVEEVLKAAFEPLNVKFTLKDRTVMLSP